MRETAQAFGATWCEEESGRIVGTTWGGTMCWWPRRPWAIKFAGDGFEGVIRCGECPGCLEFDRRRLADRLKQKYSSTFGPLFVIRIWTQLADQAALSHKLHRRRGLELEPGFFRLGNKSLALLSREMTSIKSILKQLGLEHRIERVRLNRKRRAWRVITAGVLIARDVYGEQVKRWYVRGLPPAEKNSWEVDKHAIQKPWQRATGARARTLRKLILVPPAVWRLRRADRSALRREFASATSPEGVERVMGLVADALASKSQSLFNRAADRPLLEASAVREFYAAMAKRKGVASVSEPPPRSNSPPSEGGGYVSSVHSPLKDRPGETLAEALAREKRERRERERRAMDDQIKHFLELGKRVGKKE